jgi:hypothetical protein
MRLDFSGQDAGVSEYDLVAEVNVVLSKNSHQNLSGLSQM